MIINFQITCLIFRFINPGSVPGFRSAKTQLLWLGITKRQGQGLFWKSYISLVRNVVIANLHKSGSQTSSPKRCQFGSETGLCINLWVFLIYTPTYDLWWRVGLQKVKSCLKSYVCPKCRQCETSPVEVWNVTFKLFYWIRPGLIHHKGPRSERIKINFGIHLSDNQDGC